MGSWRFCKRFFNEIAQPDPNGQKVTYQYDAQDRLTQIDYTATSSRPKSSVYKVYSLYFIVFLRKRELLGCVRHPP